MLATYESIDLGTVTTLKKASTSLRGQTLLDLIQGNHPVFQLDPIHEDTLYVYHAFGVHALQLRSLLKSLASVLRDGNDSEANSSSGLEAGLENVKNTEVLPVLLTFSVEQQYVPISLALSTPSNRLELQMFNARHRCRHPQRCVSYLQHLCPHVLHADVCFPTHPPLG